MAIPKRIWMFAVLLCGFPMLAASAPPPDPFSWPEPKQEHKPWTYWWWMGSAVDRTNITRELRRYNEAGLGGVHIIPIYGAKGYENQYVGYLTPQWMDMLEHSVQEARTLGMGVDMTTGSGWCFGGPLVSDEEANASVVNRTYDLDAGKSLPAKVDKKTTHALMAFPAKGAPIDLTDHIQAEGTVKWSPPDGTWRIHHLTQKPSGQKVKRASPGGQGHMLNLIYPQAVTAYMEWFGAPFKRYQGPRPRAQYHDSYEYRSDWSPTFLADFEKRRGYRLQDFLPAFFGEHSDRAARIKCDYRQTISDLMIDEALPVWADWSRREGFLTRNEAHGSPGNWLDLYAVADIPETEMFHTDRNKLISKFASSAAHVSGKRLVSSETGTWLKEHFTETLADMKYLLDDLYLSGVNHIFYHGTCYSPDEAPWPGWLFYASYEMNPRNAVWRHADALNAYATRCQSVLQSSKPDHDILLYWPIHELWQNSTGMVRNLTVHARDWFEQQPIGRAADQLWNRGYGFDYVSDRQLRACHNDAALVAAPGGKYRVIVVPRCDIIPLETWQQLLKLAEGGATVVFEGVLPSDVSGWANLENNRALFKASREGLLENKNSEGPATASLGKGRLIVGSLESSLESAGVSREPLFDTPGLMGIRLTFDQGWHYFLANRSETNRVTDWIPLSIMAGNVVALDPLSGRSGIAEVRHDKGKTLVRLDLQPGASLFLRCYSDRNVTGQPWQVRQTPDKRTPLKGPWRLEFLAGGPELPKARELESLSPWSQPGSPDTESFSGAAVYSTRFDSPSEHKGEWELDLGEVAQSARVRLNGKELGTTFVPPFRLILPQLREVGNELEIEVVSTSANRIRDLDRRKVPWRNFNDINFVNIDYKPFNAAEWPVAPSGLLGPVTLAELQ